MICQLESALQNVPPQLVERAVAATTAVQKLGDYLAAREGSKAVDAAAALRALGPGCIDELQPYLDAHPQLPSADAATVKEFLAVVTKRRHSTGGSRPGARGPYRKLAKVSEKKPNAVGSSAVASAEEGRGMPAGDALAAAPSPAITDASSAPATPPAGSARARAAAVAAAEDRHSTTSSGRSTPVSTPGSSRGSSRPRSPTSTTGYESDAKSPRVCRSESAGSLGGASEASSAAFTPGGTVVGLGTPTPNTPSAVVAQNGEVSLEVLLALRKLQEQNEALAEENRRLRMAQLAGGSGCPAQQARRRRRRRCRGRTSR